jgi:hypothetical protein
MPLRQSMRLGAYLAKQKIKRVEKFPLLVELEPLFACNLKCAGCGKIEQPHDVLKKRMPVEQAVAAVLESGAPMVSIAGGEPLMHKQIDEIVRQLLHRNKIVFLCTNAVLCLSTSTSSRRTGTSPGWCTSTACATGTTSRSARSACSTRRWPRSRRPRRAASGHDQHDLLRHRHAERRDRAARLPQRRPRRGQHADQPGYAYERAPDQEHWLGTEQTRALFKAAFGGAGGRSGG